MKKFLKNSYLLFLGLVIGVSVWYVNGLYIPSNIDNAIQVIKTVIISTDGYSTTGSNVVAALDAGSSGAKFVVFGSVGIGTGNVSGMQLRVWNGFSGSIGARLYCDENGTGCFDKNYIDNSISGILIPEPSVPTLSDRIVPKWDLTNQKFVDSRIRQSSSGEYEYRKVGHICYYDGWGYYTGKVQKGVMMSCNTVSQNNVGEFGWDTDHCFDDVSYANPSEFCFVGKFSAQKPKDLRFIRERFWNGYVNIASNLKVGGNSLYVGSSYGGVTISKYSDSIGQDGGSISFGPVQETWETGSWEGHPTMSKYGSVDFGYKILDQDGGKMPIIKLGVKEKEDNYDPKNPEGQKNWGNNIEIPYTGTISISNDTAISGGLNIYGDIKLKFNQTKIIPLSICDKKDEGVIRYAKIIDGYHYGSLFVCTAGYANPDEDEVVVEAPDTNFRWVEITARH